MDAVYPCTEMMTGRARSAAVMPARVESVKPGVFSEGSKTSGLSSQSDSYSSGDEQAPRRSREAIAMSRGRIMVHPGGGDS